MAEKIDIEILLQVRSIAKRIGTPKNEITLNQSLEVAEKIYALSSASKTENQIRIIFDEIIGFKEQRFIETDNSDLNIMISKLDALINSK